MDIESGAQITVNGEFITDVGKVKALYNAGWTLNEIADEFRTSVSTMRHWFKAHGLTYVNIERRTTCL